MLAAALFASLLAQAEQAPAPAAPPPTLAAPAPTMAAPAPAMPAPALPSPAPAPPSPAPAPPSPAPAEAAPPAAAAPAPPPLTHDEPPSPPRNSLSVHLRYAYRVGNDSEITGPSAGLSLGGEYEHRLGAFRGGLELGAALDFFYDRFSKEVIAPDPNGTTSGTIVDRTLSQTSFALVGTAAWRYADMRLFAAVGPGFTIGYFVSPDQLSGSRTAVQPLARAAVGFDFAIASRTAAILRVDYNHTFMHQTFAAASGTTYPLFGDIFDAGIGLLVRF